MTKNELIKAVADSSGVGSSTVALVVDHTLRQLHQQLGEGESVNLSPLGSFKMEQLPERNGRNPRTGEKITVPARKSVKFRPSSSLKEKFRE